MDNTGSIMIKIDNSRLLSLIPGMKNFHTLEQIEDMTDELEEGLDM